MLLLKDFIANHPVWAMILGPVGGAIVNDFIRIKNAVTLKMQDAGQTQFNPWTDAWNAWNPKVALWNYFSTLCGSIATWLGVAGVTATVGTIAALYFIGR